MPYETKEELLALAKIDPELDAVSLSTPLSSTFLTRCVVFQSKRDA